MRHTSDSPIDFFLKDTGTKGVWNLPYTFFFTLLIMVLWAGAQLLGMFLAVNYNPHYVEYLPDILSNNKEKVEFLTSQGDIIWPAALVSGIVGIAAVIYFVFLKKGKPLEEYLDLKFPRIDQLILWLAILLGFVFVMNLAAENMPDMQSDFADNLMSSTRNPWLLIFSIGIIVPIFEEFLFRGFLFKGIESASNHHIAVWITALVFALIHVQYSFSIMIVIVLMALILGYSRVLTKSLWTPIILHMTNNIMTSVLQMYETVPN